MPDFYTNIVLMTIFTMFIMLINISSDKILSLRKRKGFALACISIILTTSFEWLSVIFSQKGPEYRMYTSVFTVMLFSLMPTIPLIMAHTITELKHIKFFVGLLIIHFILECLSIYYGFIFYVDELNIYHREPYFIIYCLFSFTGAVLFFYSMYINSKEYQNKNNYVLFLIFTVLSYSVYTQLKTPDVYIIAVASGVSAILLYNYHYAQINQVDPTSSLLTKTCFESKIHSLKKDAIILIFDIDKFKLINDIYGHAFGDVCLKKIGKLINNNYKMYGNCYRIGGDEFCAIITKNLDNIETINTAFINDINKLREIDNKIPLVSVGYGYYSADNPDILSTIETADSMMYKNKNATT